MSTTTVSHERAAPPATSAGTSRLFARSVGVVLLCFTTLPLYRLLDPAKTGLAGNATVSLVDIYYEFVWAGLLLVMPVAVAGAAFVSPQRLDRWLTVCRSLLLRPSNTAFTLGTALIGALLTGAFSLLVLKGKPTVIDAFAQLLQARYWADGVLAGPATDHGGFWGIQVALFTEQGWVSQYPPGHIALVVPFMLAGALWLYGAVMVFLTICATALIAWRLLPDDPVSARVGVALLALSGFFVFVGGSLMNHITTAACVCWGGYCLVRAWQGDGRTWGILAGVLFAISLATRPLSTIALGTAFVGMIPFVWPGSVRRAGSTALWSIAGAFPILLAWFTYNNHFFGSPFRVGYSVTLGPSTSLGFGRDPWGNWYGPIEALAYTSSDLILLAVNLFETPLTAVLLIAGFFLTAARVPRAVWLLVAWAGIPVVANAFYWHHGIYMGPRMLHEAAPAWILLTGVSLVGIVRRVPADAVIGRRYWLKPAVTALIVSSFVIGIFVLAPQRARSYGAYWMSVSRTPLPDSGDQSLVFVHDAWSGRIAMTLASHGMRLDFVETIRRQNSTCAAHAFSLALARGDDATAARLLATLDTVPRADRLPQRVELAPGDIMNVAAGEVLTPECWREALSDRSGILDIAPLMWQARLHGRPGPGPLIVRDLGPERNRELLDRYPDMTPYVYAVSADDGELRLYSYADGMNRLWEDQPAVSTLGSREVVP